MREKGKKSLKTTSRRLMYLCFFAVLFEPQSFFVIDGIKQLFFMALILIDALLLLVWLFKKKKSKISVLVIIYHIYLLFITFIKHGDISGAIHDAALYIGVCVCTEISLERNPEVFFHELLVWLEILVMINLITIILFPNGMYTSDILDNYFFLGYDNQNINVVLPMLMLSYMRYKYNAYREKKHYILSTILAVSTAILLRSIASAEILIIFFVMTSSMFFEDTNIWNFRNLWILNIMLVFFIVILGGQKYFETLIVQYLNRTMTLSGRTYIWEWTINLIKKSFITGYGVITRDDRAAMMPTKYLIGTIAGLHAHNRYLETLFRGGVILLILYIIILAYTCKVLMKNKKLLSSRIITISLFSYLMGMITEYYRYAYFFFPMMIFAEKTEYLDLILKKWQIEK